MKPALVVENLVKRYQSGRRPPVVAVNGLSFQVMPGECFGLLGPNGAGKSTTINCITGFYPVTSGEVRIEGHSVHTNPSAARQLLGVCPQEETLDTDFSVFNQLVRQATFFRIPAAEGKRRATQLLHRFQLEDKIEESVESLSGGMRRKLQVARAFISDPKVVVLDEPTTGLDPEARHILWGALKEFRAKGLAILLSTHYMEEAERLCDRILILHHGEVLDVDSAPNLISRHMGSAVIEEEVRPGVFWKRPPNLEDVFLKLTGRPLSVKA